LWPLTSNSQHTSSLSEQPVQMTKKQKLATAIAYWKLGF
jgi:hypothetical protein